MKKIISLFLICLLCAGLAGCGTAYEDTNGTDDYSLQTITDENIINMETGASGMSYEESSFAGISSAEYYSKNFNGVDRLYSNGYVLPSDVMIRISYINVNSGNFRMVAVNDDEIIYEFEPGTFNEIIWLEDIVGYFGIHVAGESADFEMCFEIE